jgi:hypothetical protein
MREIASQQYISSMRGTERKCLFLLISSRIHTSNFSG